MEMQPICQLSRLTTQNVFHTKNNSKMNKILHFSSLYLLSSFLFILSLFITNQNLQAQTVLSQGDMAVVGVNANNGATCSGAGTDDLISIVFF